MSYVNVYCSGNVRKQLFDLKGMFECSLFEKREGAFIFLKGRGRKENNRGGLKRILACF